MKKIKKLTDSLNNGGKIARLNENLLCEIHQLQPLPLPLFVQID